MDIDRFVRERLHDRGQKPVALPPAAARPVGAAERAIDPARIDRGLQPLIDQAVDDLASRLPVPPEAIAVASAVAVVWPDAAVGCRQPGMRYAQVPVDGSLIELEVDGRFYRYHSGGPRQAPFVCDQPLQTPTVHAR